MLLGRAAGGVWQVCSSLEPPLLPPALRAVGGCALGGQGGAVLEAWKLRVE